MQFYIYIVLTSTLLMHLHQSINKVLFYAILYFCTGTCIITASVCLYVCLFAHFSSIWQVWLIAYRVKLTETRLEWGHNLSNTHTHTHPHTERII